MSGGGRAGRYGGAGKPWSAAPRQAKGEGRVRSAAERALTEPYRISRSGQAGMGGPKPALLEQLVGEHVIRGWMDQDGREGGGTIALEAHLRFIGVRRGFNQKAPLAFPLYGGPLNAGTVPETGYPLVGHYTPECVLDLGERGRPLPFVAVEVKGRMDDSASWRMRLFLACYGHLFRLHVIDGRVRDVDKYDPHRWRASVLKSGRLVRQIGKLIT